MSKRPVSDTFPALIEEQVRLGPARPAIVGAGRRLSYADLDAEGRRIARRLHALGVRRGDRVGILMGNRPEWISAALGISRLGATVVSLNTWATVHELEYLLRHSEATVLIAAPAFLKADFGRMLRELEPHAERLPHLRTILGVGEALPAGWLALFDDASRKPDAAVDALAAAVHRDDTLFIAYTSGSTSSPKGVMLRHGELIENNFDIGERMRITDADRLWLVVSLFWGYGCANALMNILTHGACLVLQEHFDAVEAFRLIEQERCTVYYGTANIAQALLEHPERANYDLSSLRTGASAGSREQMQRVVDLGVAQICNVFGLTESYGFCCMTDCDAPLERRLTTIGTAMPGFDLRIVSPETGAECAPDEVGELRFHGHITAGYFRQPEISAAALDEQGYFRSGDLLSRDAEGYLTFHGRLKEMLKTGGLNVSPAEVEAALMAHPAVALAQVVGVPDAVRDEVVAAVVVPRPGASPDAEALIAFCRERLAAFKVPRLVRFVAETDLPLTTTGKIQKNRIAAKFFSPQAAYA